MRLSTRAERRHQAWDNHQSERTCFDTPAIQDFLHRPDVREVRFPSGSVYVFVGDRPFGGWTLLEAVEDAMKRTADVSH